MTGYIVGAFELLAIAWVLITLAACLLLLVVALVDRKSEPRIEWSPSDDRKFRRAAAKAHR